MTSLFGLSNSKYLQQGDLTSNNTESLLEIYYQWMNSTTPVDRLFILDAKGMVKMSIAPQGHSSFLGEDFSFRAWVQETKNSMSPQFSESFIGADGRYRIAVTHPIIINNSSGANYIGLVGAVLPTVEMFRYYGNIYDIESRYLSVLDSKGVLLAHPLPSLVGKPFNGSIFQSVSAHNKVLNNLISTVVFSGKPSSAIYEFVNGERLTSGYPISLNGKTQYSAFIITPTSTIYSKINSVIATERLQMFSLIVGIIAAVMTLIIFLFRMNRILDRGITERTIELKELNENLSASNEKLESANEQLEARDRMQKEFINTAAHELRTPIQPILGMTNILKNRANRIEDSELLEVISRNAQRLKKLSEDVLEASKIESNSLQLNKEYLTTKEIILEVINSHKSNIDSKNIKFVYSSDDDDNYTIHADRNGISRVLSNLINNSIKFITQRDGGVISIVVEHKESDTETKGSKGIIVVSIKDNGKGIDKEIMPKLFTKFTTKSFQGTGLGLYISKSIIEAHGGRIWAENNEDGKGATFSFALPL
jgi:signal transduction histidine kinase